MSWTPWSRAAGLLALACLVAPSVGVAAGASDDVADALARLEKLEATAARLQENFTDRSGLLSPEEAKARYEAAVYAYMVGDNHRAAESFYALVESEVLADPRLILDSEWYLGESLFLTGNYSVAASAYSRIVDQGPRHPFFADGVRRLLEVYSVLGDTQHFNETYTRYIASGRVTPNDLIRYTMARSFWRQGQHSRALSLLAEVQSGNQFSRARYVAGAILAEQGDYPAALAEFQRVLDVPVLISADREINELARLAMARVYYEIGDYRRSVELYQSVPSSSAWFADELYELAWTFIKQEDWESARAQIATFLRSFPDHRYAVQLRLIDAHLSMKLKQHDVARAAYEEVVDEYGPLREYLAEAGKGREEAREYFTRVAEAQVFDLGDGVLPAYAIEMLVANEGLSRSLKLHQEVDRQRSELEISRALIEEIELAVMSGSEAVGSFSAGRKQLADLRSELLRARARVLAAEVAVLESSGGNDAIVGRWDELNARLSTAAQSTEETSGFAQEADAQVREVQAEAFRLRELVVELQTQSLAARRLLKENESRLSLADVGVVRVGLERVEADLAAAQRELERIESAATRRRVLAPVSSAAGADQVARLTRECDQLHDRVTSARGRAGDAGFWRQVDSFWSRADAIEAKALATATRLDVEEGRELERLRRVLAEESANVARHASDLDITGARVEEAAIIATQQGFGELEKEFANTVLQADMGIVDVYWIQETEVNDEIKRVKTDRANQNAELESRFALIRQKLQE